MSPEKQRIAIAEACGTKPLRLGYVVKHPTGDRIVIALDTFNECAKWLDDLPESAEYKHWLVVPDDRYPNYCNDLNAMHEAEKILNEKQQVWYLQKLTHVRYKQGVGGMIGCMIDKTTFATAAQRAEAFLRTLDLWTDD